MIKDIPTSVLLLWEPVLETWISSFEPRRRPCVPNTSPRQLGEESGFESYRDTSSDGSSGNDCDEILRSSKKAWSWHYPSDEASMPVLDSLFSRETPSINQKDFSSRDGDMYNNHRNCFLYEFFEESSPYMRQPLADKVMDLACQFPKLKTLRSRNLLPCSWISVAWYPIYRIPTGPTLQDLDTCFLTFHTLSSPFKGSKSGFAQYEGIHASSAAALEQIWILPAFGLASCKFKSSVWTTPGGYEHHPAASLFQAANNWLRIPRVNHPDFSFFVSHGSHWGQE